MIKKTLKIVLLIFIQIYGLIIILISILIFLSLPPGLNVLSAEDRDLLIAPVTKREIYATLCSMANGKSPGPDGLNAEFYRFDWKDVGDHLCKAILHFFHSSSLPKS